MVKWTFFLTFVTVVFVVVFLRWCLCGKLVGEMVVCVDFGVFCGVVVFLVVV